MPPLQLSTAVSTKAFRSRLDVQPADKQEADECGSIHQRRVSVTESITTSSQTGKSVHLQQLQDLAANTYITPWTPGKPEAAGQLDETPHVTEQILN